MYGYESLSPVSLIHLDHICKSGTRIYLDRENERVREGERKQERDGQRKKREKERWRDNATAG